MEPISYIGLDVCTRSNSYGAIRWTALLSGVRTAAAQIDRTGSSTISSTAINSFCRNGSPYATPIFCP